MNVNGRMDSTALLWPEFRKRIERLLARLAEERIPLAVFESVRAPSRQYSLYLKGRDPRSLDFGRTVTRAKPWQSAHQWGMAADLVFYDRGEWSWDEPLTGQWDHMSSLAKLCGLETLSFEKPHVQVAGFDWRTLTPGPPKDELWLSWLRDRSDWRSA